MKIRFLEGRALAHLHHVLKKPTSRADVRRYKTVCNLFTKENNSDLIEYLSEQGLESPLRETRFEFEPFSLDPHGEGAVEITNVMNIMSSLANISPAIASNEKFWAGLCIGYAWDYIRVRWKKKLGLHPTGEAILTRYFFNFGVRRSLTRNSLARLWWIGHLTMDKNNPEDPYAPTRFVLDKLDRVGALLERNTSNDPRIVHEIILGLDDAVKEGYIIDRDPIRDVAKYINIVGGVEMLDLLPAGAIREKTLLRARKICPRG